MGSFGRQLAVNDGALTSTNSAFLRESDLTLPIEDLRARYDADGYLFLKHLLPREEVLEVRKRYFEFLASTGVLKDGTAPVEGIFNPAKPPEEFPGIGSGISAKGARAEEFVSRAVEAHYEDWYTNFCKHPVLYDFVSKFTGWDRNTLSLNRTLLRNNVPKSTPIGVHYDQIFLRYGEPTSLTAWVPIGDIKLNGGGLIYLQNGEQLGKLIEERFTRMAAEAGMTEDQARSAYNANMTKNGLLSSNPLHFAEQNDRRWLITPYEAGDVVFHKPHMIHASTVNHDPDNVIRLATDVRFCDMSRPYDQVRCP